MIVSFQLWNQNPFILTLYLFTLSQVSPASPVVILFGYKELYLWLCITYQLWMAINTTKIYSEVRAHYLQLPVKSSKCKSGKPATKINVYKIEEIVVNLGQKEDGRIVLHLEVHSFMLHNFCCK